MGGRRTERTHAMTGYTEQSVKAAHAGDIAVYEARKQGVTDRHELAAIWMQARSDQLNRKDTE